MNFTQYDKKNTDSLRSLNLPVPSLVFQEHLDIAGIQEAYTDICLYNFDVDGSSLHILFLFLSKELGGKSVSWNLHRPCAISINCHLMGALWFTSSLSQLTLRVVFLFSSIYCSFVTSFCYVLSAVCFLL